MPRRSDPSLPLTRGDIEVIYERLDSLEDERKRFDTRLVGMESLAAQDHTLLIRIDERTAAMTKTTITMESLEKKFVTVARHRPVEWVMYTVGGALLVGLVGLALKVLSNQ